MTPEVYHHDIRVKPEHIDDLHHVNNVIYLQWVQDAAFAHWMTKAPDSIRAQFKWVVLKHEIEYKSPAFLDDELIAKTWVQNYSGVKSVRVVQISRKSDGKLLAEARTLWCLIHATSNKPARIGPEITQVFISEK
jgi:acyl-CoA thioester hydrolase